MEERYEHPNTEKALLEHFEDELEGACEYDKLAEAHPHMAGVITPLLETSFLTQISLEEK
jgi:hypothetical protein